jgi:hypothetical protein
LEELGLFESIAAVLRADAMQAALRLDAVAVHSFVDHDVKTIERP